MRDSYPLSLVGIGFGPQGVALAAAIEDAGERLGVSFPDRVAFFEKSPGPGWQTGMLFRNTDIQHHYLRDLATPRDPRSRFTFANFLKERDRIFEFGSLVYGGGGGAVSRIEWSEYVAWAAALLDDYVTYGSPVSNLRVKRAGDEDMIALTVPEGDILTRAVAYCGGRDLSHPPVFRDHLGERVFHATLFLDQVQTLPDLNDLRVAVVGGGQSAIEVIQYLHGAFPRTRITCVQRAFGFHHGDHSPFVQRAFHPKESDYFFSLPPDGRRSLLDEVMRANYAAVDKEAVSALYRTMYEDTLLGTSRIQMVPRSEVTQVRRDADDRYVLDVTNNLDGSSLTVVADVVVLATGYVDRPIPSVLEPLNSMLRWDEHGYPVVNYDFCLETADGANPVVFVPSAGESSHGLGSSSSFSMVALKAERVTEALAAMGLLRTKEAQPLKGQYLPESKHYIGRQREHGGWKLKPRAFILSGAFFVVGRNPLFIRELARQDLKILFITPARYRDQALACTADAAHPASLIDDIAFVEGALDKEGSFTAGVVSRALLWRDRYDISGIYAIGETLVEPTGVLADGLGLPGPGARATRVCRSKYLQRWYLRELSPPSAVVPPEDRDSPDLGTVTFPAVVKPAARTSSSGVVSILGPEELRPQLATYPGHETVLIETKVSGPEFSVESLVQNGRTIFASVTSKETTESHVRTFVELSHTVPSAREDTRETLLAANQRLLDRLAFENGTTHSEWRVDGDGRAVLMEVACRTPGDGLLTLYSLATGEPLEPQILRVALGQPASYPAPRRHARQVYLDHQEGRLDDVTLDWPGVEPRWVGARGSWPEIGPAAAGDPPALREVLVLKDRGQDLRCLTESDDRAVTFLIDAPSAAELDDLEQRVRRALNVRIAPAVAADG